MSKYAAFYKNKEMEVEAETSFEAQRKAASVFKAKKAWEVTVMLLGVTHNPESIC